MKAVFTGANKYAVFIFDEKPITILLDSIETVSEAKGIAFHDLRTAIAHEIKITISGTVIPQRS